MSTKAIRAALEDMAQHDDSARREMARAALAELEQVAEARAALRGMFEDGQLDPYPTSDSAPEYALRKWCGYKESGT